MRVKVFFLLCVFSTTAYAQIAVANFATGRGVVAPGAVAVITGAGFSAENYSTNQLGELPTDLGGVQVAFAKGLAGIRIVTPERIVCVLPGDTPTGWQRVDVLTLGGNYHGWAVIAHVAPGIVMQDDGPQGLWSLDGFVGVLGQSTPKTGAQLALTGTGFEGARGEVVAYISTKTDWRVLPVRVVPFFVPLAGLETINLALPPEIRGDVTIVFAADGFLSNEVFLTIR